MSDNQMVTQGDAIEAALMEGDLAKLSAAQRGAYYHSVCQSLGLNPLTQPFAYIRLNGKLTLYARRDATDQIRAIHKVSVQIVSRERQEDVYIVTAHASLPDGRTDESIGAVPIKGLAGDNLANALMKAETKAKRRVTLSIVGLGWLDENEVMTVPGAQMVEADVQDIEIDETKPAGWASWPPDAHGKFWGKVGKLGISKDEVHSFFNVESMTDFTGTMQDAAAMLLELADLIQTKEARPEPETAGALF